MTRVHTQATGLMHVSFPRKDTAPPAEHHAVTHGRAGSMPGTDRTTTSIISGRSARSAYGAVGRHGLGTMASGPRGSGMLGRPTSRAVIVWGSTRLGVRLER